MTNEMTTEGFASTDAVVPDHVDRIVENNRRWLDDWRQNVRCPDFLRWIESLFCSDDILLDSVVLNSGFPELPSTERNFSVLFFTDRYSYAIRARPDWKTETEGDAGYLGCVASCRKVRAGESWTRGDDLADGPYSEKTWQGILADIVRHEMVALGQ